MKPTSQFSPFSGGGSLHWAAAATLTFGCAAAATFARSVAHFPFCDGATTIAARAGPAALAAAAGLGGDCRQTGWPGSPSRRSRWWTGRGPTRVTHRVCQQIHHSFRPVLGSGPCTITRIGRVLAINTLKNLKNTLAVPLPASVAATAAISTGSPEEASGPRRRSRR